ncbi:hypothetical protein LCGC14_2875370 [marine sediment metagenome]|uniref:Uncharacterized protein n=1 Tax=marine sediment metagenome TaxID=412755 RepID=A0A0F8Y1N2_9ZZZZ
MAVRTLLGQSEHLIYYRDCGGGKFIIGAPQQTGSSNGASGTDLTTRGWRSSLKRMTKRKQLTASSNYQVWEGHTAQRDPAALYPLMPPSDMIYRIREGIACEYVSGAGVSRVGWGVMKNWSEALRGAPAGLLDLGFIGFLWYQVGSTPTNWRAVAADHAGTNLFDQDIGKIAVDVPYNMRIDFISRVDERKIIFYIDEVEVASYTPADDVLGGSETAAMRMGLGVNAQGGNVCAAHSEMMGDAGWELLVQESS